MSFIPQPWQLFCIIIGGWIHRQQQQVIDYLRTENQVLKETHGNKRILLNDASVGGWQSKARSLDARCSKRLVRPSRRTQF
jgi:hypothetical protein